ncbi:fibrobacter succinogenes major paralogous domain-containing protein [Winogradskyella litorisediminis]|uniref:Fibrobacter succinogenes major paralogous domain-containing protein n=1 Tax=Winogradskyella litorisediminis TaxID=1156618 RepID=A0ABW3N4V4_9FLAO
MKRIFKLLTISLITLQLIGCSQNDNSSTEQPELTVTDADGNIYNTITIGGQVWMLENLKTTTYNDGTPITQYNFDIHGTNWAATGSMFNGEGFYKWADTADLNNASDEELAFDEYGAIYNHFALESGKLAPEGWRIPTEADFIELGNFIANDGNLGNVAGALKSETGWVDSSGNGTNTYGFNTIPNGYVTIFGSNAAGGILSTWATSNLTGNGGNTSSLIRKLIQLSTNDETLECIDFPMQIGAGVRCIKE